MARMYPETLVGKDVTSQAEARLFESFQHELDDHFSVFHSVAWLGIRSPGSRPSDGETDFVIVHATMGVLLIEVKGGRVGFDDAAGWYSIRHDGIRVDIKDPLTQVKRNKYALIRKIESLPNWQGAVPTIGHAVAFPDGSTDLTEISPDLRREIMLLHEDLGRIDQWVRTCMKFWAGNRFSAPGDSGMQALTALLRRSWQIREPRLGEEIGPDTQLMQRYTEEQMRALDFLAEHPRVAIRGCAGSGKTMLAVEKAKRLAAEGFTTLLTCYNRGLASELSRLTGQHPRLKIQGFHALCQEFAVRTGRDRRTDWNEARPDFFSDVMPDALVEAAITGGSGFLFDAIVVDEGQDFSTTWFYALQQLLKDPENGVLYIFYDDNQIVYSRDLNLPVRDIPIVLSNNCRNTKRIHESVIKFYKSDIKPVSRGPEGRPVNIRTFKDNATDLRACLTETLAQLVFVESVSPRDIVLLSPGGLSRSPLQNLGKPGAFQLVAGESQDDHHVRCESIRLFKGLESPVVVLILPDGEDVDDELIYVGVSRARNYLEILMSETASSAVKEKLATQGTA